MDKMIERDSEKESKKLKRKYEIKSQNIPVYISNLLFLLLD